MRPSHEPASPRPANPSVSDLAAAVRGAPALLGDARLVLVDGPAGAGKTTLADRLGVALGGDDGAAPVLHADDMYEGWTGLAGLDAVLLGQVLAPWRRGEPAAFRRWDWERGERGDVIKVAAAPVVVVEGVGVAMRRARDDASLVVWVEAPWPVRVARGIERDGEGMRGHWERWEAAQNAFHSAHASRAAADVIIDGTRPVRD